MKNTSVSTVFFDLGATLVDPQFGPGGEFKGFVPLAGAQEGLKKLQDAKLNLGIISNTGDLATDKVRAALEQVKLLLYFKPELVVLSGDVGVTKASTKIFRLAVDRAGAHDSASSCAFVGDEPSERRHSRSAGMQTSKSLEAFLSHHRTPPGGNGNTGPSAASLAEINDCVNDAFNAGLDASTGPAEPNDYHNLLGRLETSKVKLPPTYRTAFAEPYIAELNRIGSNGFNQILAKDPTRERAGGLMMDMAQAILQNGEGFESLATDAFEEVVSDLYDGFLSAQDRSGIKMPDNSTLPPLVKWGNPDSGPYTWPIDATSIFKAQAAVVNLPPANARRGLFAWPALPHETAGHDVLHADKGLEEEFSRAVFNQIKAANLGSGLAEYWANRIDETASDVMGILNMGPAAGIGLIVYFRGLNAAATGSASLRNDGPADDPHPADILRGFLAASTVRLLSFSGAAGWANLIENETEKDLSTIRIEGTPITVVRAKQSCQIVAETLASMRMAALNNHSLLDIQDWRDRDEDIVNELKQALVTNSPISASRADGIYAAHVVAAAATAALAGVSTVANIFQRMLAVLKKMHDANDAWGPLFVVHPGAISRDRFYIRQEEPTGVPMEWNAPRETRARVTRPAPVSDGVGV